MQKQLGIDLLCNPLLANVSILYPLKIPENQRFFGVFRGYEMETFARNGLKQHHKHQGEYAKKQTFIDRNFT